VAGENTIGMPAKENKQVFPNLLRDLAGTLGACALGKHGLTRHNRYGKDPATGSGWPDKAFKMVKI